MIYVVELTVMFARSSCIRQLCSARSGLLRAVGSYGAFVRQLVLQKNETPVKRNFYESEDVPDIEHLLDRTKIEQALRVRHKIELMGRSSKLNQDKTGVLLYNNPLPDLTNAAGQEGIDRYLPSWAEQDTESVASYRQWLGDVEPTTPVVKSSDSMLDLIRPHMARDTSRHHQAPPTVTFLTEEDATSDKGQFSHKYKAKQNQEHCVTNPAVFQQLSSDSEEITLKPFRGDNEQRRLEEANASAKGNRQKNASNQRPASGWEPLTLNALVEYSDNKYTHGQGKFRNGSVAMYSL